MGKTYTVKVNLGSATASFKTWALTTEQAKRFVKLTYGVDPSKVVAVLEEA